MPKAAKALGVHRQTVMKLAATDHLKSATIAGRMVIDRRSIDRYLRRLSRPAA